MSDKEILEFLKESLLANDAPPLTDDDADALLSIPIKSSPASLGRVRKQFVEKVLKDLYREPTRSVGSDSPFGRWLESARRRANLTVEAVAATLGKEAEFVGRVEVEDILPWAISPAAMADIVTLFRIHISAVTELFSNTLAKEKFRRNRREHSRKYGLGGGAYTTMIVPGDRPLAISNPDDELPTQIELNEESIRLLKKLRQLLERRQALDLLS